MRGRAVAGHRHGHERVAGDGAGVPEAGEPVGLGPLGLLDHPVDAWPRHLSVRCASAGPSAQWATCVTRSLDRRSSWPPRSADHPDVGGGRRQAATGSWPSATSPQAFALHDPGGAGRREARSPPRLVELVEQGRDRHHQPRERRPDRRAASSWRPPSTAPPTPQLRALGRRRLVEGLGRVFHDRVAHLMRTGNFTTPRSASRSPSFTSGSSASIERRPPRRRATDSWIDIIALNGPGEASDLVERLALHRGRHHRRRRLADRAALAADADVARRRRPSTSR